MSHEVKYKIVRFFIKVLKLKIYRLENDEGSYVEMYGYAETPYPSGKLTIMDK